MPKTTNKKKKNQFTGLRNVELLTSRILLNHWDSLIKNHDVNWKVISKCTVIDKNVFNIPSYQEGFQKDFKNIALKDRSKVLSSKLVIDSKKIPCKIEKISNSAFKNCRFKDNILDLSHTLIHSINPSAFEGCGLRKIIFPKVEKLVINANAFAKNAFKNKQCIDVYNVINFQPNQKAFGINHNLSPKNFKYRLESQLKFLKSIPIVKINPSLKKPSLEQINEPSPIVPESKLSKELRRKIKKLEAKAEKLEETKKDLTKDLRVSKKECTKLEDKVKVLNLKMTRMSEKGLDKSKISRDHKKLKAKYDKIKYEKNNLATYQSKINKENESLFKSVELISSKKYNKSLSWNKILSESIVRSYTSLHEDLRSHLLPHLLKFEHKFRVLFNPKMRDNPKYVLSNVESKYNNYKKPKRVFSERWHYSLQDLQDCLIKFPEDFRVFINETMNDKNNDYSLWLKDLLKRISISTSRKSKAWTDVAYDYLCTIIYNLKQIRNLYAHSTEYDKSFKGIGKSSYFKVRYSSDKACNEAFAFYEKIKVQSLVKAHEKGTLEIFHYPVVLVLISFLNRTSFVNKIYYDMITRIDQFINLSSASYFADPAKTFASLGFNKKQTKELRSSLSRFNGVTSQI